MFKYGDKVVILKSDCGAPQETIGLTGIVVKIIKVGVGIMDTIGVSFSTEDENDQIWYYCEDEIEMV